VPLALYSQEHRDGRFVALHRRVAGIDVHRMLHVVTVLIEQPDGSMQAQSGVRRLRRDCRALAAWLASLQVQLVVMESTGIYWKSVYAHLENAGICAWVVNAHFIKHVPGRKTDMLDSEWLAVLARFGLVRGSFIPPKDLRELRLVSRYRRKLSATCASQVNRLHKILDDGGIKLGGGGQRHQRRVGPRHGRGLIEGRARRAACSAWPAGKLKRKAEDLAPAWTAISAHGTCSCSATSSPASRRCSARLADIDAYLMRAMQPYAWAHSLLQTIPGIDEIAAALILIEIGDDMARFGSRRTPGLLGRTEPGQQRERGQAQVRAARATATTSSATSCASAPTPRA
jgi:transposase